MILVQANIFNTNLACAYRCKSHLGSRSGVPLAFSHANEFLPIPNGYCHIGKFRPFLLVKRSVDSHSSDNGFLRKGNLDPWVLVIRGRRPDHIIGGIFGRAIQQEIQRAHLVIMGNKPKPGVGGSLDFRDMGWPVPFLVTAINPHVIHLPQPDKIARLFTRIAQINDPLTD